MGNLIHACVERPVAVVMALASIATGGLFGLRSLPIDRLPEIILPRVTVEAAYPGMGAEEVRSLVAIPLEDALASMPALEKIRSVSRDGGAVVVLDFRWGEHPARSALMVRQAVDRVYPALAEGVERPIVFSGDSEQRPLAILSLVSPTGDQSFLRSFAELEMSSRLRLIPGVASVVLVGGAEDQAVLRLDAERAVSLGLGAAEIARALYGECADLPAGSAVEGEQELVVVGSGRPASLAALSELVFPLGTGPVRTSDLGDLRIEKMDQESLFIDRGSEGIALEIYRAPGSDPLKTARAIREETARSAAQFAKDVLVELVYDESLEIRSDLEDLLKSSLIGFAAVVLTLFILIRSLYTGLLCALSLPFSVFASLGVLALAGRSLNSMSLGGLCMALGLVSDASVVILDRLVRDCQAAELRAPPDRTAAVRRMDISRSAAALSASSFAGTLTTAVVFVPVLFIPGPLGALFGDLSISLLSAIFFAWLYAQLALPSLFALGFSKFPKLLPPGSAGGSFLEVRFRRLLRLAFRHPLACTMGALLLAAAGGFLLISRPLSFVGIDSPRELEAILDFPASSTFVRIAREGRAASTVLGNVPGVLRVFGRAGAEGEDVLPRGAVEYRRERLVLRCLLARGQDADLDADQDTEQHGYKDRAFLMKTLGAALAQTLPPDVGVSVRVPQDRSERALGLGGHRTLALSRPDRRSLAAGAAQIAELLSSPIPSARVGYSLAPMDRRPELRLRPKREEAAGIGVSASRMAEALYAATEGLEAARLEINGRPLEVRVAGRLPRESEIQPMSPASPEGFLADLPIVLPGGGAVSLGSIAEIERTDAPASLARLDRSDVLYLELDPRLDSSEDGLSALVRTIETTVGGISPANQSTFVRYRKALILTVAVVVLLLYLCLGAQFESFSLPLVLLAAIPFSIAGAGPALAVLGCGLDSGAVLGLVVLFGLAVNHGITVYEESSAGCGRGLLVLHSVYRATANRFRSIVATTMTTLLALLPVVASPLGASQRSMAAAMLGGIGACALLTLFVFPPLLVSFLQKGERL